MSNHTNSACRNNAYENVSAASRTVLNCEQNKIIDAELIQAEHFAKLAKQRLAEMRHRKPIIEA